MNLGDAFSHDDKVLAFREQLRPKVVIKLFCHFTEPPKEKRLLVLSITPTPLLFVINSEINAFKQKRHHLHKQQICIRVADHDFLDRDSYIDCSKVRDDFSIEEIEREIVQDWSRMLGSISDEVAEAILEVVTDSVTLETRNKNRIVSDLC